jgi:hypothetical protein
MILSSILLSLFFPITSDNFENLKDRVVFCSVMRTERKLSDYTEGKAIVSRDRIIIGSMYRNLSPLSFEYREISEFKETIENWRITIQFKYKKQLVILETYTYEN